MANDLVKRFIKKDGSERITFYRDECPSSPRDMTDEPFHCEDWSRDYSIMDKHERETKSDNACKLIRYLMEKFGNTKEIVKVLKANHESDFKDRYDGMNCLMYDYPSRSWILYYWQPAWKDYQGNVHGNQWLEEVRWQTKLCQITAWDIVSYLSDEQMEVLADKKYFTDGVKIGSYSFGYHGGISFSDTFSVDDEGICWLEKEEFMKYSGCAEEYWQGKTLTEIEWLCNELDAWSQGEVYGFVVEECIKSKIHKEYINKDKEAEDYEEEEWEETDSCWGFYGDVDDVEDDMFGQAGLNKEDFEEE